MERQALLHSFVEINIAVLVNKLTAALMQKKTFVMCQNDGSNTKSAR